MSWTPLATIHERLDRRIVPVGTYEQEWRLYQRRNQASQMDYLLRMLAPEHAPRKGKA